MRIRGVIAGDNHPSDILVKEDKVTAIRKAGRAVPDLGGDDFIIGPTLFDIQVNGAGGINLQGPDVTPEDYRALTDYLARWGVSHWIPTLVTGALDEMEHGCRTFHAALEDPVVRRAVPGLHLEGPVICPEDGPRGAHPLKHVRPARVADFNRLNKAAGGKVIYTTVAPDVEGVVPYIRALTKRGVMVSLGHHNADADQIRRAVDAGARLCTHLGNGAMPMMQRHFNPLWPQLADDRLYASFIADLHHLPEPVLKTFVRVKGPDRTILTSDAVHLAGMKPGKYTLFGGAVEMLRTGKICVPGTDLLAGSGQMLIEGVLNTARVTDLGMLNSFAAASSVPAKLFGLQLPLAGPLEGRKANFLLCRPGDTRRRTQVVGVWIAGQRIR
jgi:N-acetylglucosamine-6-phosphate deacetylase